MLLEKARVTKVRRGWVVVTIRRPGACASCAARGACMVLGSDERRIEVRDPVGVSVGDEVEIGLGADRVVWASAIAYVVPVLAMLAGGLLGLRLGPAEDPDLGAVAGAFAALGLAALGIWIHGRLRAERTGSVPVVVRVVEPGPVVDTGCSVG